MSPYSTSTPPAKPHGSLPTLTTPIPARSDSCHSFAPAAWTGAAKNTKATEIPNPRATAGFTPDEYTCDVAPVVVAGPVSLGLPRRPGASWGPTHLTGRGGSVISPASAEEKDQPERAQASRPVRELLVAHVRIRGQLRVVAHAGAGRLADGAGHGRRRFGGPQPGVGAPVDQGRRGARSRAADGQRRDRDAGGDPARGRRDPAPREREGAARGGAQGAGRRPSRDRTARSTPRRCWCAAACS